MDNTELNGKIAAVGAGEGGHRVTAYHASRLAVVAGAEIISKTRDDQETLWVLQRTVLAILTAHKIRDSRWLRTNWGRFRIFLHFQPTQSSSDESLLKTALNALSLVAEAEMLVNDNEWDGQAVKSARDQLSKGLGDLDPRHPISRWLDADQLSKDSPVVFDGLDRAIIKLESSSSVWSFWARWLGGLRAGEPIDWNLQEQVALIPNEEWQKSERETWHDVAERIAEIIEGIEADFLVQQAPLAERIEFDADAVAFRRVPIPLEKPELIGATLSALEDAWDDVLARPANGLSETSREARLISRTLRKYGNDPQRIEMNLTDLHRSLVRQIASQDLPPSEENIALQSCAEEGALAIRASHPEIADNRDLLSGKTWSEIDADDKKFVQASLPVLRAIADADLGDEFANDIPELLNDAIGTPRMNAPTLSADAATRVFNRAAKMAILSRQDRVAHALRQSAKIVKALYDHPIRKGGTVVIVVKTVAEFLLELVRIGLKLLG